MSMIVNVVAALALAGLTLVLLERLIGLTLRLLEPFLSDDIAGPDGWLLDTRSTSGVFDRRSRL